jgi:hypothetical protein
MEMKERRSYHMLKKYKLRYLASGLAAASMLLAYSSALAAHTGGDVPLRDASGAIIADTTTPYSPKMTCMADGLAPNAVGACHTGEEYRTSATKPVVKTQGVLDDGELYWQSYEVHSAAHGATVGRHSQQGRNEDYSIEMKLAFADAAFTSSPGMYGKY